MKQYSKRTTMIHWLLLILFPTALALGFWLGENPNNSQKFPASPLYFLLGFLAFVLVLLRIYFTDHMQEGVYFASD
jgi:cytochrome b561